MNLVKVLKDLTLCAGVSGEEEKAEKSALSYLKKYTADSSITQGGVIGTIGKRENGKPHVLLDAHIDQIGFIVTYITDDGFIKFSNCGGIDRRILSAQHVIIHGKNDIDGVIISTPPHLSDGDSKVPEISDIYIDTGFEKKELEKIVSLGNKITFKASFSELLDGKVTATALDDRCGVAAILYALDLVKNEELNCSVTTLFSVQEEVGERGAKIAAFDIAPDIALAVDVSFAFTSGEDEEKCGRLGNGCMIGVAPSLDKELSQRFIEISEKEKIPYQVEVMNGMTGTNADQFSVTKGGAKAVTLSIPLKYMHTPVEVIDIDDVKNTGKLIAEYLRRVK